MRSRSRCSKRPAIHINSHSWLRSSSTHEPSDPPLRVIFSSEHNEMLTLRIENYRSQLGEAKHTSDHTIILYQIERYNSKQFKKIVKQTMRSLIWGRGRAPASNAELTENVLHEPSLDLALEHVLFKPLNERERDLSRYPDQHIS